MDQLDELEDSVSMEMNQVEFLEYCRAAHTSLVQSAQGTVFEAAAGEASIDRYLKNSALRTLLD